MTYIMMFEIRETGRRFMVGIEGGARIAAWLWDQQVAAGFRPVDPRPDDRF